MEKELITSLKSKIDKAKTACTNSEIDPSYHFADVSKKDVFKS